MNWFERRLNLTAGIVLVLSGILGFSLGEIYMYFSGDYVYLIMLPGEFGFLATAALSCIGITWILIKKNRSFLLLIFFYPLLITALIAQMMNITYYIDRPVPAIYWVNYGFIALWMTGWITLLLLKNQPKQDTIGTHREVPSNTEKPLGWFLRLFRNYPRLKYVAFFTVAAFIVIMGVISGNSYSLGDYNYVARTEKIESLSSNLTFSFEYPRCFNINYTMTPNPEAVWLGALRWKQEWFRTVIGSSINVRVDKAEYFNFYSNQSISDKASLFFFGVPAKYCKIDILDVKQIVISGVSADYVTMYAEKDDTSWFPGFIRFVYFEHDGLIWVLSMDEETSRHERYFNHLLETFTIIE